MGDSVRLGCGVSGPAEEPEEDRAPSRRLQAHIVPLNGERVGLVERDPVLDSVPELLKARFCVCYVVLSAKTLSRLQNFANARKLMVGKGDEVKVYCIAFTRCEG